MKAVATEFLHDRVQNTVEPLTGLPKQIYNYYVLVRSRDRGFDVKIRRLARFTKF